MNPPLVSVLLASRNGSRFLPEALESLARQTYPAIELLLVDDGSTDQTGVILREFARSHPTARLFQSDGIGLAGALALAARAASGTFLARQDDDDRSHPERIAREVEHLMSHPRDGVVGTGASLIDVDGQKVTRYRVIVDRDAIRRSLKRATPFVHGSIMIRRDVYERAGGYRKAFRAAQDYDLWLRVPTDVGLWNIPEPLYEWRFHPRGMFARARSEQIFYAALGRAFAEERAATGTDSIELLELLNDRRESFLEQYPRADRLRVLWGESLVREGRVSEARGLLRRALTSPRSSATALAWWLVSWPVALTPRARRHAAQSRRAARTEAAG